MQLHLSILFLSLFCSFGTVSLSAQDTQGVQVERVLIVGDSWSANTWAENSMDEAFAWRGHSDKIAVGDQTGIPATSTTDWNTPAFRQLIQAELLAHPTIDVVHLTVGGADFLGGWDNSMTLPEEQILFDAVADGVEEIINFIHFLDPTMEVVFAGYDYLNMDELPQVNPPDFLIWQGLGFPTTRRLNDSLSLMEATIRGRILTNPLVHYINNSGLMQFLYGYPSLGLPPRRVPLPGNESTGFIPAQGGHPGFPSPPVAMFNSLELLGLGYDVMAKHATWHFYDAYFIANP